MPPRAINSPKKKRSKRKGSDASTGRAGVPKKSRQATDLTETLSVPLVSLGLAEVEDGAPRRSGRPNAGTGGRNSQLEKIGAVLESQSRSRPPKGSTSLSPNIPVNPQAPEPARKGRKGRSKVRHAVPPPYSSLTVTNGPASIDNTGPGLSMHQPGGRFGFVAPPSAGRSLHEANNPHVTVGSKAVKKRATKVARDPNPRNIIPPLTTFVEQNLDPALFEEDNNVRRQPILRESQLLNSGPKVSSTNDSDDEDEDEDEDGDEDEDEDGDEDKDGEREEDEDESDEDEHTNENGYQRHNGHPGFSNESLLSQPRVIRHLSPEFDFQYSRDEDDAAAQTSLNKNTVANSQSSTVHQNSDSQECNGNNRHNVLSDRLHTSKPSDVLESHHKKNGQPRLPDPETLELLHQVAEHADDQQAPRRNRKMKRSEDGPKPTLLAWYGPRWKSFLEHTKGECRVEHALDDPFPSFVGDLPGSVTEVLIATLVIWDKEGKQFEAGVWPEQKCNMARLLYDDLSTWRSELKKTAIGLAPLAYSLVPPASVPAQERATWVQNAASQLLSESEFLRFGLDALGKTRNFAHPGLRDAVIGFFYTGPYRIARKRPDIFRKQLPISCLALVSAAYNCVLDGLVKNGHGKSYPKFSAKEYGPIYRQMVRMIDQILQHPYHGPRAACLKLDGAEETKHTHLQIVLD
ncbi:uncharacterized protein F5891DRAFT_990702 [Suillus fuscotomentosus]|uniref:DUF6532 domain-containing protein n=1 Tax=Suillus fuscotomentosus TaxID=1912939 RepID=A0AAD4HBM2_9AGAM|nr:uncharacterized protein F5891DRAFT_990702 [Suillus fuscotomentosus]KAG1883537.1 hypothetical protein F5891DRAFT_990702 [Suillus fuscotomentosus]